MDVLLHDAHTLCWGWLLFLFELALLYLLSPSIGIDQTAGPCSLCLPLGCEFLDCYAFASEFFVVGVFRDCCPEWKGRLVPRGRLFGSSWIAEVNFNRPL